MSARFPLEKPQLAPLTSLRFFAAGALVVFHLQTVFGYQIPGVNFAPAVTLFFVLSGFILTYVYPNFEGQGAIRRFYLARFARIWPLHALTVTLALVLLPVHFSWDWLLANLMLVQAWVGHLHLAMSFNGVAWTISNEAFFYVLFPLVILTQRWLALWWLGCLSILAAVIVVGNTLEPISPTAMDLGWSWHNVSHVWPPVRFIEFLAGITAARLFLRCPIPRYSSASWSLLECACLGLLALSFSSATAGILYGSTFGTTWLGAVGLHWFSFAGAFPALVLVVTCFAYGGGVVSRLLSWKVLVLLGEISFATYMLHQLLANAWRHSPWWQPGWNPAGLLVALAVIYGLSWLVWRFFENPARRGIRSLSRAQQAPESHPEPTR